MIPQLAQVRDTFNLDIHAPFSLRVGNDIHVFQCLIKGYGGNQGMVVDKDWAKISVVKNELVQMGFGYSCFDIEKSEVGSFQEVLDDWGAVNV